MGNCSYLFKYIQPGDRILLYGKGKNGGRIFHFLEGYPAHQIVGWVDRNADRMTYDGVPLYRTDQLKDIPSESYDKILLTVLDQKAGMEIYRTICEYGIDKEKIVAPYTYLGPVTGLSVTDFIHAPHLLKREIVKFIDGRFGNLVYFEPLIQNLKLKANEKEEVLQKLKKSIQQFSPLESVVCLYVLCLSGIFDAQCMEYLLLNALKIHQPELRQFLQGVFNDTSLMCFDYPEYLFPNFYILRRSLLEKLCKMYDLHIEASRIRKSGNHKIKRICIVSMVLYDEKSSPTLVAVQLSRILIEAGYEVKIIPLDSLRYTALNTPIFSPVCCLTYDGAEDYKDYHKRVFHSDVSIEYTNIISAKAKMQYQLDKLAEFSPDLIIDMSDEFSIPSYIYSQYYTTLYLPMRGYQSSSFFSYYIARDKQIFLRENSIYNSIAQDCIIECEALCILPPRPRHEYRKKDFLMEGSFALITVGLRLNVELTHEFCDLVCEKLLSKSNIKWLIVGSKNEYLFQVHKNLVDEGKIIYVPYENDLPALYNICDAYLNPGRMGGGASVYWAMYQGLPVAILSTPSDILPAVGIENTVGNTYEEMVEYVLKLWSDENFYRNEGNKFQQRAEYLSRCQVKAVRDVINTINIISREEY